MVVLFGVVVVAVWGGVVLKVVWCGAMVVWRWVSMVWWCGDGGVVVRWWYGVGVVLCVVVVLHWGGVCWRCCTCVVCVGDVVVLW